MFLAETWLAGSPSVNVSDFYGTSPWQVLKEYQGVAEGPHRLVAFFFVTVTLGEATEERKYSGSQFEGMVYHG